MIPLLVNRALLKRNEYLLVVASFWSSRSVQAPQSAAVSGKARKIKNQIDLQPRAVELCALQKATSDATK